MLVNKMLSDTKRRSTLCEFSGALISHQIAASEGNGMPPNPPRHTLHINSLLFGLSNAITKANTGLQRKQCVNLASIWPQEVVWI